MAVSLLDINLNDRLKNWSFRVIIDNVFDPKWKEAQFASSSRLQNEEVPDEEIHFIPGTPFFAQAKVSVRF
ncbi:hypothetical protein [Arenibacter nanhaiticus]|uniref:hypothetical protein n=1 Tax=Arenibacter nanhaiticus TaxID=558155 RepID=UPI000933819A|nr:hypothetical protein [Arenibacter nanhaiticus]